MKHIKRQLMKIQIKILILVILPMAMFNESRGCKKTARNRIGKEINVNRFHLFRNRAIC